MSKGIDSKEGQAGSVLERGEGLVESDPLRESLGALRTEFVVPETAKERRWAMSKGADSRGQKQAHGHGHRHGTRSTHLSSRSELLVLSISQRAMRPLILPSKQMRFSSRLSDKKQALSAGPDGGGEPERLRAVTLT